MRYVKYTIRERGTAEKLVRTGLFDWFDRRAKGEFVQASERAVKQGHVVVLERCNRDGTAWGAASELTEAEQFDAAKIQAAEICADPAKLDAFMEEHPLPPSADQIREEIIAEIQKACDALDWEVDVQRALDMHDSLLKKRARDLKYRQARRTREKLATKAA